VFHGHIRELPGEDVAEKAVEVVLSPAFALAFGDADPPNRGVARTRDPKPSGDGAKHPPSLGVRQIEFVENPQRADESGVHGRVERHPSSVDEKSLCVWNTKPKKCFD
jgi:hypothetical protein